MQRIILNFKGALWTTSTRLAVVLFCVVSVLTGCSNKGDFGRPQYLKSYEVTSDLLTETLIDDDVTEFEAKEGKYKGSRFALTRPEIILRDSTVHFNQSLTNKYIGPGRQLQPTAYAEYLTSADLVYGPSRVGVMTEQIRSDRGWLHIFSKAARKIKVADGERAYFLALGPISITNQDRVRTYSRIQENEQIVYATFIAIDERIAAYTYAIERMRLELPGVGSGGVLAELNKLRTEAAMARVSYDKIVRRKAVSYARIPGSWRAILKRAHKKKIRKKRRARRRTRRRGVFDWLPFRTERRVRKRRQSRGRRHVRKRRKSRRWIRKSRRPVRYRRSYKRKKRPVKKAVMRPKKQVTPLPMMKMKVISETEMVQEKMKVIQKDKMENKDTKKASPPMVITPKGDQ